MEKDGIGAREPGTAIEVSSSCRAGARPSPASNPIPIPVSVYVSISYRASETCASFKHSSCVASDQYSEKPVVLLNTTTRNAIAYREPPKMLAFKKFDYPGGLALGVLSRTYGYEEFVAVETPESGSSGRPSWRGICLIVVNLLLVSGTAAGCVGP